jgi:hypothetical protein
VDKQNQLHLDRTIRESVPTALDSVGMREVAAKFRELAEITNPYQIEMARGMLGAILPGLRQAGQGLSDIIKGGCPEAVEQAKTYQSGLTTAKAIIEAARVATMQAVHGGQILN